MKKFLISLADWIYKKKCYCCSKSAENAKLCSKCFEKIELRPYKVSKIILGKNVYCAAEYKGVLQKIIRGLKYHKQREMAYYTAKIMFEYWKNLNDSCQYIVVPVPLSKEREKKRKYNQTVLIGEEFCKMTGFELNTDLIQRIKNTKPQYNLSKKERMENLDKAFAVNPSNYSGEAIILIDDICTTGATFESIIMEFEKNNISKITCFALSAPTGDNL